MTLRKLTPVTPPFGGADGASAPSPTSLGCGGPPGRSASGDVVSGARHRAGRVSALAAERSGRWLERGRPRRRDRGTPLHGGDAAERARPRRGAVGRPCGHSWRISTPRPERLLAVEGRPRRRIVRARGQGRGGPRGPGTRRPRPRSSTIGRRTPSPSPATLPRSRGICSRALGVLLGR